MDDNSDIEEEFHQPRLNDKNSDDEADKELQVAFQSGLLKPGLFRKITAPPPKINKTEDILEKLEEIKQNDLDWVERLDVTVPTNRNNDPSETEEAEFDVHNDFQREHSFYEQAKDSVILAMKKLHKAGVRTKRPEDYFAEMAKKDDHMKKVREKLLVLQRRRETIDRNKKNSKLRKFGKQVHHEVVKERQHNKKQLMNSVKKFRKDKTQGLDFLEDPKEKRGKKPSQLQKLQQQNKLNYKRASKNQKYGHGGKKKRIKSNTKESFNDVGGKFKGGRGVHGKKGKNMRPGKSKRTAQKGKR